jgi:hypothetical protein
MAKPHRAFVRPVRTGSAAHARQLRGFPLSTKLLLVAAALIGSGWSAA